MLIPALIKPFTARTSPSAAALKKDGSSKLYPRSFRNRFAASGVGWSLGPGTGAKTQAEYDGNVSRGLTQRSFTFHSAKPLHE